MISLFTKKKEEQKIHQMLEIEISKLVKSQMDSTPEDKDKETKRRQIKKMPKTNKEEEMIMYEILIKKPNKMKQTNSI